MNKIKYKKTNNKKTLDNRVKMVPVKKQNWLNH